MALCYGIFSGTKGSLTLPDRARIGAKALRKKSVSGSLISWTLFISILFVPSSSSSWGFFAHRKINQLAVFSLPPEMIGFYKRNIDYLTDHATDPDNRRYLDPEEAPKHYIDLDHYECLNHDLPRNWYKASELYTEDTLKAHGIVPWNLNHIYRRLIKAFAEKDEIRILRLSAELGHYCGDAHVPLHTTENYNGQLTNQKGIHGFWESRLPELYFPAYDMLAGRAVFIENTGEYIWKIIDESFAAKDSVLQFESDLNSSFPSELKYGLELRNNLQVKVYTEAYSERYHQSLNGMVERRMRKAVHAVSSLWYSAWVEAGQPDLSAEKLDVLVEINDSLQILNGVHAGHED